MSIKFEMRGNIMYVAEDGEDFKSVGSVYPSYRHWPDHSSIGWTYDVYVDLRYTPPVATKDEAIARIKAGFIAWRLRHHE